LKIETLINSSTVKCSGVASNLQFVFGRGGIAEVIRILNFSILKHLRSSGWFQRWSIFAIFQQK